MHSMPTKTSHSAEARKKAALRQAVYELLDRTIPVIRDGGDIPLRSVAEAIAGEKLGSNVRRALDARGRLTFSPAKAGKATFENTGEARDLALKSIKLKIPKRLSGWADVLDGDQGVVLHFDKHHTLSACKMLVCADVEAVELTKRRIFVDMEGKAFDKSFDLGAPPKGKREAPAVRKEEKTPSGGKVAAREARQPRAAPKRVVEASARREERSAAGAKAALGKAVRDAKSNVRAGVGQTLRSAAESQWAAKQAVRKAARDVKTNLRNAGRPAASSQMTVKETAPKVRARPSETVRSQGSPTKGKESRPRKGGYLGVTTFPVRVPAKLADEKGATGGLIVLGVQPDGPADQAGLQLGDTLLELGGRAMRKPADLRTQVSRERVGHKLDAVVLRAGKTRHVTVEVGAPGGRRDLRG